MKPGIPWSVKGIEPDVREAAKQAARRSGMTLGEWLNSTILGQAEEAQDEAHDVRHAPIKARG
jgi:localization factor PodJL